MNGELIFRVFDPGGEATMVSAITPEKVTRRTKKATLEAAACEKAAGLAYGWAAAKLLDGSSDAGIDETPVRWYCDYAASNPEDTAYHDHEYGFPCRDERALFERLTLEVFQAGLSWRLILKKRPAFVEAFGAFDPERVAAYDDAKVEELLWNAAIIRNRMKISATIKNAWAVVRLREEGGWAAWLDRHHPLLLHDWVRLFREHFLFMGPEIVGEFLYSLGFLPGAHRLECPTYRRVELAEPPFLTVDPSFWLRKISD